MKRVERCIKHVLFSRSSRGRLSKRAAKRHPIALKSMKKDAMFHFIYGLSTQFHDKFMVSLTIFKS